MSRTVLYFDVGGKGGGSNHSLRTLLGALDRARYRPVLCFGRSGCASHWPGEQVHGYSGAGFDNYDFFPAAWSAPWLYHLLRFLVHAPYDALRFAAVLQRVRPDLVHINCGQALIPGLVAQWMGVPVIWHVRELVARNGWAALQRRWYHGAARRLVAISAAVADRLRPGPRPVELMYNPVRPTELPTSAGYDFRRRHGIPPGAFTVLLLGNMTAVKGYLYLLAVSRLIPRTERVCFVLAGNPHEVEAGPLHRLLRRLYRAVRRQPGERMHIRAEWLAEMADGRACFTGHVAAAEAIAGCDVVACPNLVPEPFGRTVAEAQAAGKPVLASRLPAFDELIEDGVSGRLLPLEAEAIRALARDRAQAARLGTGGRAVAGRYDATAYAERMMSLYDEVLGPPAGVA